MSLGEQVRKLRKNLGLTQRQFAARIPGRGDYSFVGKIERGGGYPSIKFLMKVARTYQVPVSYFFLEGSPQKAEALDAYLEVSLRVKKDVRLWLLEQLPVFEEELKKKIEESIEKALKRLQS